MNDQSLGESFKRIIGLSVSTDPLGKLTRQRQLGLLIASVVLIILSSGMATLSDATIFGVKFEPAKKGEFVTLAGLLCLYFFVGFIVSCVQDWRKQRINRIPGEFERTSLKEVLKNRIAERRKEFERMHAHFQDLVAKRNELSAQIDSGSEIERERATAALGNLLANDGLEELTDKMLDHALDRRIMQQVFALYDVHTTVSKFDRVRLLFEILFPVLLGIFALGSAIMFLCLS